MQETLPNRMAVTGAVVVDQQVQRPIRVFMMDLLSIVPYYTGHLCAALKNVSELQVEVGTITYHLDPEFFRRKKLQTNPGALDIISKVRIDSPPLRRVLKTIEWLVNMVALLLRFAFSKPDLIHVQFLPMLKLGVPLELWFLRLARKRGIKVIYTVHNVLPHDSGTEQQAKYKIIYSLADRLICHDICAKQRLIEEFQVPLEKISVIAHGPLFDQPTQRAVGNGRQSLGLAKQQTLVLWQGILRPYKGVSFLLQAWRRVMSELGEEQACLAIVGNGDQELIASIQEEVASLGIAPTVKLDLRFISVDEMTDLYLDADVLVYPYSEVTTSGALMTGIGYGKAIIATRLPAFEQLLHDEQNALLVSYGNADELASTLLRLIRDEPLRQRLGDRAKESYSNGSQWSDIAGQTLQCYQAALQPGAGCQ